MTAHSTYLKDVVPLASASRHVHTLNSKTHVFVAACVTVFLRMVRGCPYCTPDSGPTSFSFQLGVSRKALLFYSTRITAATFLRAIN